MEQARMFLAIVLSFLVFLFWNLFFVEKTEIPKNISKTENSTASSSNMESHQIAEPVTPVVPESVAGKQPDDQAPPPRTLTIKTPLYTVAISEKGAAFTSCKLANYREHVDSTSTRKELVSSDSSDGTFTLDFQTDKPINAHQSIFTTTYSEDLLTVSEHDEKISFSYQSPEGIIIQKTYIFSPLSYLIGLDIRIGNRTDQSVKGHLDLSIQQHWGDKPSNYGFEGPCAFLNNRLEKREVKDLEDQNKINGVLQWVSIQDRYFLASIIPKAPVDSKVELSLTSKRQLSAHFQYPLPDILPAGEQHSAFDLYLGPKSVSILGQAGYHLDKAIDFGWFDFIAKPCLWLMNFLHGYIPNYGVTIIILTILIKILFWPLGNKSYKSMNEMKKLQPLMAEIREKYKDDKKKMNEEVMGLYKTYKINPLGGCLPMVAQIPVFFALYQMLYGAIELRHAPFFGWILDLSAPDRLLDLGKYGISIPFMEPPYGIPVLTIVMGATMLIQQKLQPPAGDPTQAKMMMFMPIIFTVIFINFSSGLVLYWLVNNVLSIAQQYYVSKKNA